MLTVGVYIVVLSLSLVNPFPTTPSHAYLFLDIPIKVVTYYIFLAMNPFVQSIGSIHTHS
jgi:hypothetical protein